MGSQHGIKLSPPPQPASLPAFTRRAASPYLLLTTSRMSLLAMLASDVIPARINIFKDYAICHIYVKANMMYTLGMPKSQERFSLDLLFRALADPTRLHLLNLIADREICVCYFVEILRTSQPKISRHLAYLRKAGIVAARREGKWMHYRLVPPPSHAGGEILEQALHAVGKDKRFKADRERLKLACCRPQSFVSLQRAPQPLHLANSE